MNMHRARRLASVAVVASLAVTVLSACRSQPSVAAYVGDQRITEAQVQTVWDNAKSAAATQPATDANGQPVPFGLQRGEIVQVLATIPVLDAIAKQDGLTPGPIDANTASQDTGLPATTTYTKAYAQEHALLAALKSKNQNAPTASDADLQELHQNLLTAGAQVDPNFASFKSTLTPDQSQQVNASAAVGQEVEKAVAGPLNVRVNPRYGTVTLSLLDTQNQQTGALVPLITAPLNPSASPAPVVDES
jgi:hypothetical protein